MLVTKLNRAVKSKGQGKYHLLRLNLSHENIHTGKKQPGLKDYLDEMLSSFIWLG